MHILKDGLKQEKSRNQQVWKKNPFWIGNKNKKCQAVQVGRERIHVLRHHKPEVKNNNGKYQSDKRRWSNSIIEDFLSLYFQAGLYLVWPPPH